MPIRITLVEDVSSFLRGMSQTEDALDSVADSLDDVAREAQRAGDQAGRNLGDGVSDAGREVGNATERMERSFRDMARSAQREAKDAGESLGREVKDGADEGVDAVGEFKDEAVSNFSEVASSFSGDMDSAADLVQGTLGGLAGSLGPAGLLVGVAGAAAGAFYARWKEASEATAARIAAMYDDLLASGNEYLSEDLISQNVAAIVGETEDAIYKLDDAQKIAQISGADMALVLRAVAGDAQASTAVQDALRGSLEAAAIAAEQAGTDAGKLGEIYRDTTDAEAFIAYLQGGNAELDKARDKASLARAATAEWQDTLAKQPREVRTALGFDVDVASYEEARAKYDGLGRTQEATVRLKVDATDAQRWIDQWRPQVVGVLRAGTVVQ